MQAEPVNLNLPLENSDQNYALLRALCELERSGCEIITEFSEQRPANKLNIIRNGKYIEIARYDSGLHEPHLDIIGPDGSKKRIIDYSILENDQALNVAIQDF